MPARNDYRLLGKSEPRLSPLGLGAMTLCSSPRTTLVMRIA